MRCTELFCGAGGASLGLHHAGYDVTGYDAWVTAVATHNANGITAHQHDLSDPVGDEVLEPCDLLWASPPCQPFSAAGDGAGEFDDRDGFPWTLRIVATLQPSVVIVENVKGLTFDKHAEYFGSVLSALTALGYEWQWRVLNSADYGVPQTRERCFIVARRDAGRIVWPAPTHAPGESLFLKPWMTMADALGRHGLLDCRQEPAALTSTAQPARTVGTMALGQWVLDDDARHFTIAELATLQGFPADWQWTGTKTEQARQVGNAVPPVMAQVLATANRPIKAVA